MISRNKAKWTLLALPLLAGSISSAMADSLAEPSGELIVTGVYQPQACYVSLANNGTIDYGRMHASAFNTDTLGTFTSLPVKTLTNAITLNCPAKTSVAITTQDNRAATVTYGGNDDLNNPLPFRTDSAYAPALGLGVDSAANKIGNYISQLQNVKGDGIDASFTNVAGAPFRTTDPRALYPTLFVGMPATSGFVFNIYDNSGQLLSAKVYTMDYSVSPQIAPTSRLNLSRDVVLDGSITVSFYYL